MVDFTDKKKPSPAVSISPTFHGGDCTGVVEAIEDQDLKFIYYDLLSNNWCCFQELHCSTDPSGSEFIGAPWQECQESNDGQPESRILKTTLLAHSYA